MRKQKRIVGLIINRNEMYKIIKGERRVCYLPEDAEVVGVNWDHPRNAWFIVLEHESFDLHEPGTLMPIINAEFETIKKQHNK